MALEYIKTLTPVNTKDLQTQLNEAVDISATCTSVHNDTSLTSSNITIVWSTSLTTTEEVAQDAVIANYIYVATLVDTNVLPLSDLGNKLAIHSSSKPAPIDSTKEFYLMWTGAGDDITSSPNIINAGPMLQFTLDIGTPSQSIEVHYSPDFGDVYIHEGYAKWEGGGLGDYLEADVVASASALQTSANLDLEIANNWVTYAAGGPGTGTHGFAATPTLIKRSKSKDGDWDYNAVDGLTPNPTGTGLYKISDIDRAVHHYFNKIPTRGSSYGYTTLTSDESAFMPPGYFIRITANNISDTKWDACVFMEVYREQTAVP